MAVAAENGAPKTELQELQMKSNQVTDEVFKAPLYISSVSLDLILYYCLQSLESTRRMMLLCEEVSDCFRFFGKLF